MLPALVKRARVLWVIVILVALGSTLPADRTSAASSNPTPLGAVDFPGLAHELFKLEPDLEQVARVRNLVIHRDAAIFILEEGELALGRPVRGRVCAAYFAGRGRLAFSPHQDVEREQLRRRLKSPDVEVPFISLVLLFADSTAEELRTALTFQHGRFGHVRTRSVDNLRGFIVEKTQYVDPSFARTLLEDRHDRTFVAMTLAEDFQRFRFQINPYKTEEVTLSRGSDGGEVKAEPISQFRLDGLPSDDLSGDTRPALHVRSYLMDVTLASGMTPVYVADLGIEVVEDSVRFLPFYLADFQDTPDSVRTHDGQPWQAYSHRKNPVIWFDAGRRLRRGEHLRLHMRYRGSPLANWANIPTLHSSNNWYPIHDFSDRAFFDLTFHYRRPREVISVGDSVSREESEDGQVASRWRSNEPTDNATWHIGQIHKTIAKLESLPEICLVNYEGSHAVIGWELHNKMGAPPRARPRSSSSAMTSRAA